MIHSLMLTVMASLVSVIYSLQLEIGAVVMANPQKIQV
jgi:hypothetical protein